MSAVISREQIYFLNRKYAEDEDLAWGFHRSNEREEKIRKFQFPVGLSSYFRYGFVHWEAMEQMSSKITCPYWPHVPRKTQNSRSFEEPLYGRKG